MASFPDLRPDARSAQAESWAMPSRRPRRLAGAAVLLAAFSLLAFLAVSELATLRGTKASHRTPAFLSRALGSPDPKASLSRTPAPGFAVRIHTGGFRLRTSDGTLSLTAQASGGDGWSRYEHGALRSTSAGQEAVTVDGARAEESLRVTSRHGLHTWRWQLDTNLEARLAHGHVGFFNGHLLTRVEIEPVRILDDSGRDVTPKRAQWSLVRRGGANWLELSLDDSKLPVPYTIDPVAVRTQGATGTTAGAGTLTVTIPSTARAQDLLVLHAAARGGGIPSTTATGWAAIANAGSQQATAAQNAWWKTASSSDANTTVDIAVAAASIGWVDVIKGVDTSASPIRHTPANTGGNGSLVTCPLVTTNINNEFYLCFAAVNSNGVWPSPSTSGSLVRGTNANNGTNIGAATYTFDGGTQPAAVTGTVQTTNGNKEVGAAVGLTPDTDNPSNGTLALANVSPSGSAYTNGSTIYYNSSAGGSFQIQDPFTDTQSAPESVQYPLLNAAGWSPQHSAETVSTPGTSFQSSAYTWTSGAASPAAAQRTVTQTDGFGHTTTWAIPFVPDNTPPAGGALTVNGTAASSGGTQSYNSSGSFTIGTRTDYSETQSGTASGLASSTLVRTSASFTSADTCGTFGSPATLSGTPAQNGLTTGCYRYTLTGTDYVGNPVSISTTVKVDTSAPGAPTLSFANLTGGAYFPGSGSRVYFKPDAAGGGAFDLTASATDSDSGIGSYTFPAGSSLGTNWSASGSGATRTYSYSATATSSGSQNVSATNNAGLNSPNATFTPTADSNVPTGGALTVNGTAASGSGTQSYNSSGSFTIGTRTDYSETQSASESGLASSTLVRTSAPFSSADTCGTFGSPATLSGTPAQNGLPTGCYRYTLTGTDNVGNTVSISTIVKVDTSAPSSAPTLSFANVTGAAYYPGSGGRVYFKPDAVSGGAFDLTASASDSDSGIGAYTFPSGSSLGTNWSGSGSGATRTYSYIATATSSGSQSVGATNNAGLNSPNATFTPTADSNAPTGGALTVNGTAASGGGTQSYNSSGSFTIGTRTDYGETQSSSESGLASSTLVRTSASFSSADTCGTFGSAATLSGTPAQNGLATGCYRYTLTGTDNVGNAVSISTIVKVDTSAPSSAPTLSFANVGGGAFYAGSGSRIYFKPDAASGGAFDVTASASDADSGIASYTFPAGSSLGSNWAGSGSGATRTYSYTATATSSGAENVTATNNAGLSSPSATFTPTADSNAPTGAALMVNATAATAGGSGSYSTSGSFTIGTRTDYSETQSSSESGLASSTLVRTSASFSSADTCGSFGSATTLSGTPAQNGLATGCYRYTLTGTDNVGNATSISTTVKVDTTGPATPTLTLSNATGGAYYSGSGTTVFVRPDAASGSFDVAASSTDGDTGIAGYTFPAAASLGAHWSASGSGANRTYSFTPTAEEPGTQTVSATNGAGASASAGFTVTADSGAPTTSILCNGAACLSGTYYTSSPVSATLSSSDGGGSGVDRIRYTTDGSTPTLANGSDYSSAISVSTTTTVKWRAYDRVGNVEAVGSQQILLDGTPPTGPTLTLTENPASGAQFASGTTLFYRPGASGTFRVSAATADAETGIASVSFPAVANVTGGGAVASSPYEMDYTWGASTSDAAAHSVGATNGAGAFSSSSFTLAPDSTAPGGQSITLTGAGAPYYGSASVTFALGDGSDGLGSGLDLASRTVTRESAPLNGDACGTFTTDGGTYSSPDTSVSGGHCYRYTFAISDNVGNSSMPVSATAKVDTVAPNVAVSAPTVLSGAGAQSYDSATKTLYFRPGGSGSFRLNATASDGDTAVSGVTFPDVSGTAGWSGSTGGPDTTSPYASPADYAWTSGASAPGAQSVSATDKAGNSASDGISIAADGSAPSGQTITLTGASAPYFSGGAVTFTLGDGTDSGSGLDTATRTVTRETGTLANGACSNYTADAGTYTSPDSSVSGGHCYRYTFTIADKVGNVSSGVTATAKVDTDAAAVAVAAPTPVTGAGNQYYDAAGQTLYFRPSGSGSFTLNATASDGESGVSAVDFPDVSGVAGWSGSTGGSDTSGPYASPAAYTWTSAAAAPAARTITATNGAGITSNATVTIAADSSAPSGQAIALGGAGAPYFKTASVSFSLTDGSDTGAGIDTSSRTVTRESAALSGDACGTFTADAGTFSSPDTSASGGHCYRYTFTIADRVGNTSAPVSVVAKVDTAAPTVAVTVPTALAGAGNQSYDAASKTLFFRSTGSGSFTLNATASDTDTAVTGVAFPDVSGTSGWSGSTGGTDASSPYSSPVTYAWSSGAGEPGAQVATASDKAGNGGTDGITLKDDTTAPSGQTIALTGTSSPYFTSASVTFALTDGTDNGGGSGLDTSSRTVTRETGTLANGSCSGFAADAWTFTSPDTSVSGGHCYRYTFAEADKVGNLAAGVQVTAKVDTADPAASLTDPGSPLHATVALSASASDAESDVQQVTFQRAPAGGSTWTTIATDATAPFAASWNTTGVTDGLYDLRVVATDGAGRTGTSSVVANRRVDNTAPDTSIDSHPSDPSNDSGPVFQFSSSESGSTFECRLDGGGWSPCASPDTLSGLSEATHTFDVRATDAAGNTDGSPATYTWTIDDTAPETTIDAGPSSPSNNPSPTFQFSSDHGTATFECRLDGGAWASCASPDTFGTLTAGSHTFDVRARTLAGTADPTPASRTWAIDLTQPTVSITSPAQYVSSLDPPAVTVAASTPDADVATVDFYECSDSSVGCSTGSWSLFATDTAAPYSAAWTTPALDGPKAIRAVATDDAGNTGEAVRTVTIDRTAPTGVTISYPDGYAAGSVTITTGNGGDPDVDAASGVIERQTGTLANDSCTGFGGFSAATSPNTVASGHCAIYRYRVGDAAGNVATATSSNVVKSDTDAPTSTLADPGSNLRQTITLTSNAADTGGSGTASVAFQRRATGGGAWTTIASDSTAPFSASLDTTSVADGLYDLRSVATDLAGNAETSPVLVASRRIDNTAPSATMQSPGNPVSGVVNLASDTSDGGSGVAGVVYELAPHGGAFATQPSAWDTTAVIDGLYDIRVTATDAAGNTATSAAITTRVDNTPPSITFDSPAPGDVVSGIVSLVASGSDAAPANPAISFAYKLHSDTAWTSTAASWNTTALPAGDGVYDLRATATDDAGNTAQSVHANVRVDNVPPSVTITAPAASVNASTASPTPFTAAATDAGSGVSQVEFFECSNTTVDCAGGTFNSLGVDTTAPYATSWNIPSDGNHALEAVASDNAGHPAGAILNVTVDSTPPDTSMTIVPGDPSNVAATFAFASTEAGSTFECRIDGGAWNACTSPKTFSGLTDGLHTVDVRATDIAGNTDPTPATWSWHRDTGAPAATMHDPGRNVRGTVHLTSALNDPAHNGYASGISSATYEYSADGTTWAPIATLTSAPYDNVDWDTTAITDGVYELRVTAMDVAGNSTPSTPVTSVRVDNTPPTTSQDDPGAYLRATDTVTGSAADTGSGVDHVDFQQAPAGSGAWTTIGTTPTAPYSIPFDTTAVTDGHYDFRTVAYDVAGNSAASTPVTSRLVDNTPPTATMNDPSTVGGFVRGTITLSSTSDDPNGSDASGVAGVAYEYSTDGGSTWTNTGSTLNTKNLPDGGLQLHAVVTDRAGNTTTSTPVTDTIDNTRPVTTDDAPSGWQDSDVTVHLSASDAGSGIDVTEYSVDGGSYSVGTSVTIPAPSDGSNDGAHTIAYFSADKVGNVEQVKSATVLIDASPPACPSCSAADYLRGTVTLSASPADAGGGIKSVAFQYTPSGGSSWTTIGTDTTGPAPYTASWDTTLVADGHYDLRVRITDNANNVTTKTLADKVVDNTPPNVAVVGAPTEGAVVSGNVAISASAADVTSPVASVEFIVGGSSIATDTSAPYDASWDSASGADGPATIQVIVTDLAGNSATSGVRTISVDNRSPSPALDDPAQYLRGTVTLSASSDPDTTQVDFQRAPAGSGTWTTISTAAAPFSITLDTTTLADGLYDFRAVATDGSGNTGTSAVRTNKRVDNTSPAGALTAPAGGATVGGPSVHLASSPSDAGSGVASVSYEERPTGGGSFTPISTATSAPFDGSWDTTGLASGDYDLRPVITDRAGNAFTGATVTVHVDTTAPTVALQDAGLLLSGTVTLGATVTGSGAAQVAFSASPAGANAWQPIATDSAAPWSVSFDTTRFTDGLYDLRAVVSDSLGNTSQDVRTSIRLDNTAPRLVSSTPSDASTVASATSIELVASETTTATSVTLDGAPTVAPVITGTHIVFNTGALATGLHVLAGRLEDGAGKSSAFRVHFTVWPAGSPGTPPPVEGNSDQSGSGSITSADGFVTVTVPSGAYTSSDGDWIVIKVRTMPAPSSATNGFAPGSEVAEVTAYWALSGQPVHHFERPLQILLRVHGKGLVPATVTDGWHVLRRISSGLLPVGWDDGFMENADGFLLSTLHLSQFTALQDVQAPAAPDAARGYRIDGRLVLTWAPGADNSGTYDHVSVLADGSKLGDFATDVTRGDAGPFDAGDPRKLTLRETDLGGNDSPETAALARVPTLLGKTGPEAEAALAAAGFELGNVTVCGAGKAGTVTAPDNLVLAEPGDAIDIQVAPGGSALGTLGLSVVTAKQFRTSQRAIGARVVLTRRARVTATLIAPHGLPVSTLRATLKPGASVVRLRVPRQLRRPGMYTISWLAQAGSERAVRSVHIRLVGAKRGTAAARRVVLAGSALPARLPLTGRVGQSRVGSPATVETAFALAGAGSAGAEAIVVDADEFGIPFLRDLRTVFPRLKIVALSRTATSLARARRVGATVALPTSTPNDVLASVVAKLLRKP